MEDLVNIRLSKLASDEATRIQSACHFKSDLSVARLGMALALKKYSEQDIIEWLELTEKKDPRFDSSGTNYNIGSVDPNKTLSQIIRGLFPSCKTPYRYIRSLMNIGILELGEQIKDLSSLNEYLKGLKLV